MNGVNANEHNEGRGSANAPISSLRQSTTGSRLFFKPPSPSLPTSNSPCQESVFREVTLEAFLGFVCLFVFPLVFSFKYELNFNSLSPVNVRIFHVSVLPQVMILSFPRPVIWTLSHLTGIKVKVFAITFSSEVPKPKKISHSGERGGTLGTSRSPSVTGFVSMKICICFVCKMKHNLIYPMTS